jgi:hypothetical protein
MMVVISVRAAEDVIRVTVAAGADVHYAKARAKGDQLREESYVFGQGTFFAGAGPDATMAELPFAVIAKQLALGLAEQGYLPTRDQESADVLIVAHWGVTRPVERDSFDSQETLRQVDEYVSNPSGDPLLQDYGQLEQLSARHDAANTSARGLTMQNARLLGYTRAFRIDERERQKAGRLDEESQLQRDLGEERFFIIVMAWDNTVLREEKKRTLLWITHCNTIARGKTFREALPALCGVGGKYFGRNLETLKSHRVAFATEGSPAPAETPESESTIPHQSES